MPVSPQEKRASRSVGHRIAVIIQGEEQAEHQFDPNRDPNDFGADLINDGLSSRAFDWVSDSSIYPDMHRQGAQPTQLFEIVEDIVRQFRRDEQYQYSKEEDEQNYIEKSWGNADNYRKIRNFFIGLVDESDSAYMNLDRQLDGSNYNTSAYSDLINGCSTVGLSKAELEDSLKAIKKGIAEFELMMESYQRSMDYPLKQIHKVQDIIDTVVEARRDDYEAKDESTASIVKAAIDMYLQSNDDQEQRLYEVIQKELEKNDLDSPLILDHVHSSMNGAFQKFDGLNPDMMKQYFRKLEEYVSHNQDMAESIAHSMKHTREYMDQMVEKEYEGIGIKK